MPILWCLCDWCDRFELSATIVIALVGTRFHYKDIRCFAWLCASVRFACRPSCSKRVLQSVPASWLGSFVCMKILSRLAPKADQQMGFRCSIVIVPMNQRELLFWCVVCLCCQCNGCDWLSWLSIDLIIFTGAARSGDDRGLVSLYRFPALGGKARVYGGHSSHVTTVRFAPDGSKLYSAGGGDACIMEWALL